MPIRLRAQPLVGGRDPTLAFNLSSQPVIELTGLSQSKPHDEAEQGKEGDDRDDGAKAHRTTVMKWSVVRGSECVTKAVVALGLVKQRLLGPELGLLAGEPAG